MSFDKNLKYSCGKRYLSFCISFGGTKCTCGEYESETLKEELDNINTQLEKLCKELDFSSLKETCIDFGKDPKLVDIFNKLTEEICILKDSILDCEALFALPIDCLNLDYKCLADNCGDKPTTFGDLLQLMIDKLCSDVPPVECSQTFIEELLDVYDTNRPNFGSIAATLSYCLQPLTSGVVVKPSYTKFCCPTCQNTLTDAHGTYIYEYIGEVISDDLPTSDCCTNFYNPSIPDSGTENGCVSNLQFASQVNYLNSVAGSVFPMYAGNINSDIMETYAIELESRYDLPTRLEILAYLSRYTMMAKCYTDGSKDICYYQPYNP